MYKTKIFYKTNPDFLEHDFNEWTNNHPNISIIDFRYIVGTISERNLKYSCERNLEYSIAVLYKE